MPKFTYRFQKIQKVWHYATLAVGFTQGGLLYFGGPSRAPTPSRFGTRAQNRAASAGREARFTPVRPFSRLRLGRFE